MFGCHLAAPSISAIAAKARGNRLGAHVGVVRAAGKARPVRSNVYGGRLVLLAKSRALSIAPRTDQQEHRRRWVLATGGVVGIAGTAERGALSRRLPAPWAQGSLLGRSSAGENVPAYFQAMLSVHRSRWSQ